MPNRTHPRFPLRAAVAALAAVWAVSATAQAPSPGRAPQAAPTQPAAPTAAVPPLPRANPAPLTLKPGQGLPPEVFNQVLSGQVPLSPKQVREVTRTADDARKAAAASPAGIARPVSSSVTMSLAPGLAPHVLRLADNTVTTVVFTDATGAGWPISSLAIGNKDAFSTSKIEEGRKSNILTISPLESYANSNISILLEGAPAPITMILMSGQNEVDFRLDVVVQGRGPNAQRPVIDRGFTESIPADLVAVLDGVPPGNAIALRSSHVEVRAWMVGKRVLVRTRMNLLSPAAIRAASSADGTRVFEIPESPVLLTMSEGVTHRVTLTGFPAPALESTANQRLVGN